MYKDTSILKLPQSERDRLGLGTAQKMHEAAITACEIWQKCRLDYIDVFNKWYRSRKHDPVYVAMFTARKCDLPAIRKHFEAGALATSEEWYRRLQVARNHLSVEAQYRLIKKYIMEHRS
jgi:hypothetical protein